MKRGYRANNLYSFSNYTSSNGVASFADMLGMTSGNELRGLHKTASELFPEYINPGQALGRKQVKRQVADRPTQKSITNYPKSKKSGCGNTLTASSMRGRLGSLPAAGEQWSSQYGYRGASANFANGLSSMVGIGRKSNPFKTVLDQSMPGNTHIMNPSPNVGNPYNLIKKGEATIPTRIKTKTPVKNLKRGAV